MPTARAGQGAILGRGPKGWGAPYTKVKNKILPMSRIGEQTFVRSGRPRRWATQDEVGIISHALNSRRGATPRRDRYVPRKSRHRAPAHGRNGRTRWFAHRLAR